MKCVYSIQCKDNNITDIYIGSTIQYEMRIKFHKYKCNSIKKNNKYNKLYKFINNNGGIDNWSFIVEQNCDELNKHELRELEQIYIDLLKPQLNTNLKVNKIPPWVWK